MDTTWYFNIKVMIFYKLYNSIDPETKKLSFYQWKYSFSIEIKLNRNNRPINLL